MRLRILGSVRLQTHVRADLGATKVRGLLGYLAYRANEPAHVSRIAEALWDDDTPPDVGKTLHTYASRLRRALRSVSCAAELTYEHRSYQLRVDPAAIDYHQFVALSRKGYRNLGSGQFADAVQTLTEALALWTGPPVADLDTTWAHRLRETLSTRYLVPAHCALAEAKIALGEAEFALTALPHLLADHPHDERIAIQWVRALAAANRAGEVPVFFREFADRLHADLRVPPTNELVHAVETVTAAPVAAPGAEAPRDTPYFTGRDDLLAQLDALIGAGGAEVVAMDGAPGVGKTALATHWGRRLRARFPDGTLFVDLAGYAEAPPMEPHTVVAQFLAELGIGPTNIPAGMHERALLLRSTLAMRNVLVILDNARNSAHVRPLLAATANSPVLITSRQQLTGITYRDGVHRLSVPALAADEAAALLVKRIGRQATEHETAIGKLVELCQGLPLALRIVAEHVAMRPAVPIDELAEELRQTKRLLDAGAHGDDHTTTLRSTFSLSYRALGVREQRLFRLLGLHPGTRFSVSAVRALGHLDSVGDAEQLLDTLVGAHLVSQERAGRYHSHDLLHRYANTTVHEDEPEQPRDAATRRLFDWYLQSAINARELLAGDDQPIPPLAPAAPVVPADLTSRADALRWLDDERGNLVACAYRARQLGLHEHVWRFAGCLNALSQYEDPRGLLEIHELGRQSAELAGATAAVGGCLNNKGTTHARLNEEESAGRCFELAYQAFDAVADQHGVAVATHNLGVIRLRLGQPAEAIRALTAALAMSTRGDREWPIANNHRALGDAYRMLDRFTEARSHYRQAWYTAQKIDDLAGRAASLSRLAALSLDEGQLDDALTYGRAAVDEYDRIRVDKVGAATALRVLAGVHLRRQSFPKAAALAREAVRTYREAHNPSGEIDALILLGHTLAAAGEPAEATGVWTDARALMDSDTDPRAATVRTLLDESTHELGLPGPREPGAGGGLRAPAKGGHQHVVPVRPVDD